MRRTATRSFALGRVTRAIATVGVVGAFALTVGAFGLPGVSAAANHAADRAGRNAHEGAHRGNHKGAHKGGGNHSPITICVVSATSGPFVELGTSDVAGAKAWATHVDKHGGVLGHHVKLVIENDQSNPATAATVARKCITQDNAQFIFGPEETSTAAAVMPITNAAHIVTLGMFSGWKDEGLPSSQMHGSYFPGYATVFAADDQAMLKDVVAKHHLTRVAVIQDNAPGGLVNGKYVKKEAKKYGATEVSVETTNPGSTNDSPEVLKLLAKHPQAIISGEIPGPDSITAFKAIRSEDPTIPIGVCAECAIPSFISAMGGTSGMQQIYMVGSPNNIVSGAPSRADKKSVKATKTYLKGMKAAGDTTSALLAAGGNGWDVGEELQAAIKSAHSTSESAVLRALKHQKLVVGGEEAITFARTPSNYGKIARVVVPVDIVKNGKIELYTVK